jgi:hypothetical protein
MRRRGRWQYPRQRQAAPYASWYVVTAPVAFLKKQNQVIDRWISEVSSADSRTQSRDVAGAAVRIPRHDANRRPSGIVFGD